jgi:hypothetical protein
VKQAATESIDIDKIFPPPIGYTNKHEMSLRDYDDPNSQFQQADQHFQDTFMIRKSRFD